MELVEAGEHDNSWLKDIQCHVCGKKGHKMHKCPNKTDAEKKAIIKTRNAQSGGASTPAPASGVTIANVEEPEEAGGTKPTPTYKELL